MEQVRPAQIRNVAFLGHPKSGKTTLVEAILHTAGLVSRAGRVEDGNTVSDYTPEEHEHGYSVTTSVVTLDWDGHRLHLLDTPGFPDFEGEAVSAAAAVEAGVVLVDAVAGIEGGVEAACEHLDRAGVPARFFVVSRLDREHADFGRVVAALQARFGEHTVPIALPAAGASGLGGLIDLVAVDPAHEDERAHDARDALIEAVAESDDALLERYLEGEEIDAPTLRAALAAAVASGAVVPVLPLCATGGIGVRELVDALVAHAPPPTVTEDGPALARVFRTTADPYVGHLSFVKVLGGCVTHGDQLANPERHAEERAAHLFLLRGKEQIEVPALTAGSIGAIPRLAHTHTGDLLAAPGSTPPAIEPLPFPVPTYRSALAPHSRDDVDRMSQGLARLLEQDRTLRVERDADTGETVLLSLGDVHAGIAVARLAREFGVSVDVSEPRVPYRETVSTTVQAEHRHKKQTGGRGQFGHVVIRVEPLPRGAGFEFAEEVVGGAVPRQFIPAVQHGIEEALVAGPLAKARLVDLRVVLTDGSSHPVDSSEMAFKTAAAMALHEAVLQAHPVLLEPVMRLTVEVPSDRLGDLTGEISGRRGQVLGVEPAGAETVVNALAPLAEVQRLAPQVRAIAHGRGRLEVAFDHYAEVPPAVQQQVVAALAPAH
ncbi:MAG: elongation factor G [Dehalococcoidia bacterium]|nr:elongation factor G [Dehalococcoidia bacterium]